MSIDRSRVLLDRPPYAESGAYQAEAPWQATPEWPATWVGMPQGFQAPGMALYRCKFSLATEQRIRLHVTADEGYELYLDGTFLGRGSERGDRQYWYYESYDALCSAGEHLLVARVRALGPLAPWAQVSIHHGFFCCPDSEKLAAQLATGKGAWETTILTGCTLHDMSPSAQSAMGAGPSEVIQRTEYPWGWERGISQSWEPARSTEPGYHGGERHSTREVHWLTPATLPAREGKLWQRLSLVTPSAAAGRDVIALAERGVALTIPPHQRHEVILDLGDYLCAYPEIAWEEGRGTTLSLGWAEALIKPGTSEKIRAGDLTAAEWQGPGDTISPGDQPGRWQSHWWRCGRFLRLSLITGNEPLTLTRLALQETRYPFPAPGPWKLTDPRLEQLFQLSVRTWQMCAHETYMDCPYYEQLMYVGDTRLQALLTYTLSTDDRLARKAIKLYDSSRHNPSRLVAAAHPCNGGQTIPPFALWWIAMVYDHARWRGNQAFIRECLPGIRATLDLHLGHLTTSGVIRSLTGWNFLDWSFTGGVPPGGLPGECNASFHAQLLLALQQAESLERYAGDPDLAKRWARLEKEGRDAFVRIFWNEERGLFADDVAHQHYSEHTQCLALICGGLTETQKARLTATLETPPSDLVRVSSYFAHYLFEATLAMKRPVYFERLEAWFTCAEEGFKTLPETFGETRSDCHAWSAHPLYHYITGVLGIQPGAMGFSTITIQPHLGPLTEASGECPHPQGIIRANLARMGEGLAATIDLPEGLHGEFRWKDSRIALRPGTQQILID